MICTLVPRSRLATMLHSAGSRPLEEAASIYTGVPQIEIDTHPWEKNLDILLCEGVVPADPLPRHQWMYAPAKGDARMRLKRLIRRLAHNVTLIERGMVNSTLSGVLQKSYPSSWAADDESDRDHLCPGPRGAVVPFDADDEEHFPEYAKDYAETLQTTRMQYLTMTSSVSPHLLHLGYDFARVWHTTPGVSKDLQSESVNTVAKYLGYQYLQMMDDTRNSGVLLPSHKLTVDDVNAAMRLMRFDYPVPTLGDRALPPPDPSSNEASNDNGEHEAFMFNRINIEHESERFKRAEMLFTDRSGISKDAVRDDTCIGKSTYMSVSYYIRYADCSSEIIRAVVYMINVAFMNRKLKDAGIVYGIKKHAPLPYLPVIQLFFAFPIHQDTERQQDTSVEKYVSFWQHV